MRKILIVLFLIFVLVATGCTNRSPENVVKEFLDSFQAGDFPKAAAFTEQPYSEMINNMLSIENKDADIVRMNKLFFSKTTYEVGATTITGDQSSVKVKITTVDYLRLSIRGINELTPMVSHAPINKEMDSLLEEYIYNSIADPHAPKVTTDIVVNLVKTKDGWVITNKDNNDLYLALVGKRWKN